MNDVTITVQSGGLGRRDAVSDAVSGLVAVGVAQTLGVQLDTPYQLTGISDAEALGIDASYDSDNSVYVYEHIKEYFRINPNGTLWLLICAQTVSLVDMVNQTSGPAKTLISAAGGDIKRLGVVYNNPTPPTTFDMSLAVPAAQNLCSDQFQKHNPIVVLIAGGGFDHSSVDDLTLLSSPNVAVVVGGHSGINDTEYTMLGTALGVRSLARVNQNIGWVTKFNIAGDGLLTPTISGDNYSTLTDAVKEEMNTKGYIFPITHIGRSGVYFNDDHTCVDTTNDQAYLENVETINKAARLTREALLPFLNSPINIDPDSGKLSPEVVKSFESAVRKLIDEQMQRNSEVSSFNVYVDENQNILSTSELKIDLTIVPTGTARKINVSLGFSNPF